jgi:hypothetical protein
MFLFLILILIVVGIFMIRGQSERQHWQILKSVNPEAAKKLWDQKVRNSRAAGIVLGSAFIIFWFTVIAPNFKSPPKQNKEVVSKVYSADGTLNTTISVPSSSPINSQPAIIYKEWSSPGSTPKTIIVPQPTASPSSTLIYREYPNNH